MTQEEQLKVQAKELLLKDLCARLPYGVKVEVNFNEGKKVKDLLGYADIINQDICVGCSWMPISDNIKPYLRPMSSMTEEEKKEILNILCGDMAYKFQIDKDGIIDSESADIMTEGLYSMIFSPVNVVLYKDFLNSHYLDYRGIIPMGLALEAPEGMYK